MQKKQLNTGGTANARTLRKNDEKKKMNKGKKVTGKRKKLDMDKDGKLTKKDFAMLEKVKRKRKHNEKRIIR
ncbi:MAG: hypothetical protein CM15mV146_340 [uncultured marine virus]|nr:MAG: hypothetical protein CM15mV146_340 [uncultured marine virus]